LICTVMYVLPSVCYTVTFCYSSNNFAKQYTGSTLLPVNSSQLQLVLSSFLQLRFL